MERKQAIRVAAVIEATTVTGPAKNLLSFFTTAGDRLEPLLVTFVRGRQPPSNPFLDAVRECGFRAVAIPEGFRFDPRVMPQLRKEILAFQPDILQTHNVKSSFFVRATGMHWRFPWLAFHHGYTSTHWRTELYNHLDRWSMPAARGVVTVCGPFVDQLVERGISPSRIRVQHNAVRPPAARDEAAIARLREQHAISAEDQVVLTVGRLSKEKAQADLIRAVAQVTAQQPSVRLVVVGEGPERDALERLAAELGLRAPVFAGQQSQVQPYYGLASVFVLPSLTEGSPNVVLEAMAAGVPIVATAVGGVPELVDTEMHALLAPPGQPGLLAEAIQRMLGDGALRERVVAASRQRIVAEFTPEAHCQRMLALYREVLAGNDAR